MSTTSLLAAVLLGVLLLGVAAYKLGVQRAVDLQDGGQAMHSTPDYYGWFVVSVLFVPAVLLTVLIFALALAGATAPARWAYVLAWVAPPLLLGYPAWRLIGPKLRARVLVEWVIYAVLLAAASISILTTLAILLSVLFESFRFFEQIGFIEFITGSTWDPGAAFKESVGRETESNAEAVFGAVPLFAGTFLITAIAMLVAVPIGLMSAVFLSEYASSKVRKVGKPLLEVLAGIPTVVYGFFAAVTVGPMLSNAIADASEVFGWKWHVPPEAAIVPGAIMGIMIIPFMSSLCDDVISSVPQSLRRASLAMGATKAETIKQVTLPAAMPGVISAFLLSVSRAIGETMIVVMAAGMNANLTANPFEQVTTVTVQIVASLTGDLAYDNPQTLAAFSLGLVLVVMTLLLNIVAAIVIRRYRRQYAQV